MSVRSGSDPPIARAALPLQALIARLRLDDRAWTAGSAARVDTWLDLLEHDAAAREALGAEVAGLLLSTQHVGFYADLGVLSADGVGIELRRRALHAVLPAAVDDGQFEDWARQLFGDRDVASWMLSVPADRWQRLVAVLGDGPLPPAADLRLHAELLEAMKVLSARIAATGVDPLVARVHPDAQRSASPFLEQQPHVRAYVDGWARTGGSGALRPTDDDRPVRVLLDQCRAVVARIRRDTGRTGVTVRLTYRLQRLVETIDRLEALLDLVEAGRSPRERWDVWIRFMRQQVRACADADSLRALWRKSTHLAAREITEHAGRTGEHYIAADRGEWWALGRSAMVGGVVIAFMAILKILIASMHAPVLVEGTLVALNYGLGFVFIHLLHGTVATKQPAMTAARIAAELDETDARAAAPANAGAAEIMVQVWRSQAVAVLGNVGVALPLAALIAWTGLAAAGVSPASPEKAAVLIAQLDPLGATLFYAALAGVCLFLAGVISGYCDNLAVFHRIPQRVARMPLLLRVAGPARAAAAGAYVEHNVGALVGNFLFGCMLGGVTLLGQLTGLPLDIRHVAFASANLGVAGVTLWPVLGWPVLVAGLLGVMLIGAVNLAVSFTLSLLLALRARRREADEAVAIWRAFARRVRSRPTDLLRPPPRRLAGPAHPEP
jgi:site-specific recombinase